MTVDQTAYSSASQSLRDTAKWYAGSVGATAAGVFAGTSLTNLGSMSLPADQDRLMMAAGGALTGFLGLSIVFWAASGVLTRELFSLERIVRISSDDDTFKATRDKLNDNYKDVTQPYDDVATYLKAINDAYDRLRTGGTDKADKILVQHGEANIPAIQADASFLLVRERFQTLTSRMGWAALLAISGFGLFAWAANPPKPPEAKTQSLAAAAAPAAPVPAVTSPAAGSAPAAAGGVPP